MTHLRPTDFVAASRNGFRIIALSSGDFRNDHPPPRLRVASILFSPAPTHPLAHANDFPLHSDTPILDLPPPPRFTVSVFLPSNRIWIPLRPPRTLRLNPAAFTGTDLPVSPFRPLPVSFRRNKVLYPIHRFPVSKAKEVMHTHDLFCSPAESWQLSAF